MKKDTPKDVIRAGKNAAAGLRKMQLALDHAQTLAGRLQDREFAARVLAFSEKSDRKGLSDLIKAEIPRSRIQVKSVEDFKVEAIILVDSKQYYVCIGDGCHHHSGKKSPIVFEES